MIVTYLGWSKIIGFDLNEFDKSDMLRVLVSTKFKTCSDPRDKLFAILGLTGDISDVQVDYSLPVAEVYRTWSLKHMQRTKSLDIFGACQNPNRSSNLPSWVPDPRD
jgi:hypothetical protein